MNEHIKNINLNWTRSYIGVLNNWIGPSDVMDKIDGKFLENLGNELIAELYEAADESKEKFLKVLEDSGLIAMEHLSDAKTDWAMTFLNAIAKSNHQISEKLRQISDVWARFDYPESWKHFIYYMPTDSSEERSEKAVYRKFLKFLEDQMAN